MKKKTARLPLEALKVVSFETTHSIVAGVAGTGDDDPIKDGITNNQKYACPSDKYTEGDYPSCAADEC